MAKIIFNNKNYNIDESALAPAMAALEVHLRSMIGGADPESYVPGLYQTGAIDFYNTYGTSRPAPEMNEYGFYFGLKYRLEGEEVSFVFYEDGSAVEIYMEEIMELPAGSVTYEAGEIIFDGEVFATVNADGTLTMADGAVLVVETAVTELSDMLIMSWDDLIANGYMTVDNGVLTHTSTSVASPVTTYDALAACALEGDLLLPEDGSIVSIGDNAFDHDCPITGVLIPDSIANIGYCAFYGCMSLTSIEIPESVTSMGDSAFYNCRGLASITFNGTTVQWNSITKGANWNKRVPATYVQCSDGQVAL